MDFLKNRIAVVTGVNNPEGIGAAIVKALTEKGAKVALVYKKVFHPYDEKRTEEKGLDRYFKANASDASQIAKQLESAKADFIVMEKDITDEENAKEIFDETEKYFGRADILINNAAYADEDGMDTIETISGEIIDHTFGVNVKGLLMMCHEFVRRRPENGRIINLSTDAAQTFPGQIAYGASKAAVEALTRSLALETAKYGMTVNCIAPGPTQTGYISGENEERLCREIPLGQLIAPSDIADAAVFLAGEHASKITGQIIKVSGGHAI